MNILLIGGTGFIGEYLLKKLIKKTSLTINVVHSKTYPSEKKIKRVKYNKISYSNYIKPLKYLVTQADTLILLTPPECKMVDKLVLIIKSIKRNMRIIYLSSILIYPNSTQPQSELTKPNPQTEYEKSKFKEEKILSELAEQVGVKLCIARMSNVYGDVKNKGIIHKIFHAAINNDPLIINNDGSQIRDFIFIEDATNFISSLIFLKQVKKTKIYNVCSSRGTKIIDVISMISKLSKTTISITCQHGVTEKNIIIGDNKRILQLFPQLGLKYDLAQGLIKTYNNYLKNVLVI